MYLDIVLSRSAMADAACIVPTFVRDELENLTDSDHKSDWRLRLRDFNTASSDMDDIQNHSGREDVSHPPVCVRSSGHETIPGGSRLLGEVASYTELNLAMTNALWSTFSSEKDFNWASWCVRSMVAKSQIDQYFVEGLGGTDSRLFRSGHILAQHHDLQDPFREFMVWVEASIHDSRHATTFGYRNIIDSVRYLIRQVAYS